MLPIAIDTLSTTSFRREENSNYFTINPKLVKAKDTLHRPFIPSDSLTLELLRKGLGIPVIKTRQPLPNSQWDTLWTPDPTPLYKALLHYSDNLVAESLLLMVGQQVNDTLASAETISRLQEQWASWLPDPLEWVDGSGFPVTIWLPQKFNCGIAANIFHCWVARHSAVFSVGRGSGDVKSLPLARGHASVCQNRYTTPQP